MEHGQIQALYALVSGLYNLPRCQSESSRGGVCGRRDVGRSRHCRHRWVGYTFSPAINKTMLEVECAADGTWADPGTVCMCEWVIHSPPLSKRLLEMKCAADGTWADPGILCTGEWVIHSPLLSIRLCLRWSVRQTGRGQIQALYAQVSGFYILPRCQSDSAWGGVCGRRDMGRPRYCMRRWVGYTLSPAVSQTLLEVECAADGTWADPGTVCTGAWVIHSPPLSIRLCCCAAEGPNKVRLQLWHMWLYGVRKYKCCSFFCVILEYTACVQWIRCSPEGSHLIHWKSAVFFS